MLQIFSFAKLWCPECLSYEWHILAKGDVFICFGCRVKGREHQYHVL